MFYKISNILSAAPTRVSVRHIAERAAVVRTLGDMMHFRRPLEARAGVHLCP